MKAKVTARADSVMGGLSLLAILGAILFVILIGSWWVKERALNESTLPPSQVTSVPPPLPAGVAGGASISTPGAEKCTIGKTEGCRKD